VQRRGPKARPVDPSAKRIVELERELARMAKRAERAEALVEVQKKVSALLDQNLNRTHLPRDHVDGLTKQQAWQYLARLVV